VHPAERSPSTSPLGFLPNNLMLRFRARAHWALAAILAVGAPPREQLEAQDTVPIARGLPPTELHGFIQVYYRGGDPLTKDGYRLRKADLKFSGSVSPNIRWRVGFDAAKVLQLTKTSAPINDTLALLDVALDQRTRILQDAALTWLANRYVALDIGQQIVPLSLEGTISTSKVETIERTMFIVERSRATGLGDVRDIGVSANGTLPQGLEYHVGLFNETGESAGTIDANDQKAFIGRFVYHPAFFPHLSIGGSGGFEGGARLSRRERGGTEVEFKNPLITLRAETMAARDGDLRRFGWYNLAAIRPTDVLQFVARYDSWDKDRTHETSVFDAYERQVSVGASYLIDGTSAKIAFNIVRQTFPNVNNVADGTFALIAFQGLW
jgi:hypothetical protein